MNNPRYGYEQPLHMRTVHVEAWRCPWCRKQVEAGEVHDDRPQDKYSREKERPK